MGRTQVTAEIQALGHDARVEEGKCNPRCLRKLCQATQAEIDPQRPAAGRSSPTSGCWTQSS